MASKLRSAIENGTISEVKEIIARLRGSLPDYGQGSFDRIFDSLVNELAQAEELATAKREALRAAAKRLVGRIEANWTTVEIEIASGY